MGNFEQLILQEQTAKLTLEEREFVEVHKRIVSCAKMTGHYLFETCREIKRMHDGKLYLAAGFEKFGDYTEQALKIKERQAYNYIKVVETYDEQFITENAELGITKLTLLASASKEVSDNLLQDGAADGKTVDELAAIIKEQEKQLAEQEKQLNILEDDLQDREDRIKELEEIADMPAAEDEELKKAYEEKELELVKAKQQAHELEVKKKELEGELKAAKKSAKEVKTVPDEESKKLAEAEKARADELEQKLRETTAQLAAAKEQKKIIASDDLLIFKVKFGDLQRLGEEIKTALDGMSEENAAKCRKAVNAVLTNWKEEMQL